MNPPLSGPEVSTRSPRVLRFDRAEAAGALGDLGTFIPLLVGMVNRCGLQLGPALFCAGLMNVITALTFGIPMPVQPMKAIATVAIAEGLTEPQILAAGILTGATVLLLALTGLVDRLTRILPRSVVRGLQLALGLKLLTEGFRMIANSGRLIGWDSIAMGIGCAVLVLLLYFSTRVPGALAVFAVGLAAMTAAHPTLLAEMRPGMTWVMPRLGNAHDWLVGLSRGAVPQIPLTLLNSVIAVCALSADLFPHRPAAPRRVAISVALMNLVFCPLGSMPMCHGAGGLAGQYRFGARTGGSVVMLGAAKMILAAAFGGSLLVALRVYPQSVLGVLLLFGGLELALVCRDQRTRIEFFVMILTAGACLAVNAAVGFLVGWAMAVLLIRGVVRIEPPGSPPSA
ncbi:MAG: putative sulfate/molybdate transporter [Phycisphaerae bacterium]